jgi:long-chain acyl-CoA synthetase
MNLASIIDSHPADRVALISRGRATTYGALREQVDHLRGGLASLGVGEGDRVALLCSNARHFVISYLATLGLGAVAVPLNPLSPSPELQSEIAGVGAKVVVIEKVSTATWKNVDRSVVPTVQTVVTCDPASAPDDAIRLEDLLAVEPVERVEVDPAHLATLIFTSGTAGQPRAAMLTHRNLQANIEQTQSPAGRLTSDDVIYGVLPLFHIFGLNVMLSIGLAVGATVVLVQRFDPLTAAETIRDRKVTVVPGPPSLWASFAHFDELPADTFSSVRLAVSGAAKLPVHIAELMQERFGLLIREGYGLTESSATVTSSLGSVPRFGSVGRALAGVEMKLVNADGTPLVGDVGEIWLRGDSVFAGYYDDAEATAQVLTDDGWLKTGDIATVDDDGFLYLVDRAKDLVIVSGFNVFPAEVEDVLAGHPEVIEAGVIGVPHPHTGEAVKAFVVATPDALIDEDSLIEYCLDHLARYKCPSKIMFVESLPRNANGKLVRRDLVLST